MTETFLQMESSGAPSSTSTPGSHGIAMAHNLLPSPSMPYHSQQTMQPSDEYYSYIPTSYPPSAGYQASYQPIDYRSYDNPTYWNEPSTGDGAWYSQSCNQENFNSFRAPSTYAHLSPVETLFGSFDKNERKIVEFRESENAIPCDQGGFLQLQAVPQNNEVW